MRQIVWTSTIGSLADGISRISRANPGPDALKPLVVDHTQLVRQTEMMIWIHLFDGIKASDGSDALKPLVVDHTQLVRQRHQGIGWIWCLKTIGFDAPLVSTLVFWQRMDLSMLKSVCQRTNGWCTDGFILCQTNRKNIWFLCKSLTCLPKNKSVWTSTIGSLADGISRGGLSWCLKTIGVLFIVRIEASDRSDALKPLVFYSLWESKHRAGLMP